MKQPVVLRIYKGDTLDSVRQFGQSQIVIGSTNEAQLELQDEGVALLHAMIEDRDGDYYVSDLGSATGTFRNGAKVLEAKIEPGDELNIGGYRLQFFVGVPKPSAPPKALTGTHPIEPPRAMSFGDQTAVTPAPAAPSAPPVEAPPVQAPPAAPVTAAPTETADEKEEPTIVAPPPVAKPVVKATPAAAPAAPAKIEKISKPAAAAVASTGAAPSSTPSPSATLAQNEAAHKKHNPSSIYKKAHNRKTFAPGNPYKDIGDIVKPGKGNVVEVLVTWNNKILSSNHFSRTGSVYLSSNSDADVVVPILSSSSKYELVKLGAQVTVCLTQEMTGDITREGGEVISFAELSRQQRVRNVGTHFELDLRQGESARVSLQDNLINLIVRFKPQTPTVGLAPVLAMTSSEITGLVLAFAVALITGLYMNIVAPSSLADDEAVQEEPIRLAKVQFKKQVMKEEPKPEPVTPPPEKKKVVEVKDQKQAVDVKQAKPAQKAAGATSPGAPGAAGEPKPNPKAKPNPKVASASPPGAAVKTGAKDGANMAAQKPDVNKQGLLSAFGSKGAQKTLSQAYSGSGELQGMANAANGAAGSSETRAGDSFGSKLKDSTSGKGSSTVGIAGVGTQGRGTGTTGYGTGGIGQHGSAQINIEGSEGFSPGGMDREAIRRVIRDHLREIRNCYEKELQRSPDLIGKVVLEWDIGEGGKVTQVSVKKNDLGNAAVASCVASHLKTWKFPDPPKDQIGRVVYPFVFSSQ